MLGRFRGWKDPIQLEDLVLAIVGQHEFTTWFKEKGRKTRNAVAHGNWGEIKDTDWFVYALMVMDALVVEYLKCWMSLTDRKNRRPGRAFVKYAEQKIETFS